MNRFGTREEISISGSVFVFAGIQQNAFSSFLNRNARLTPRGLMRGSFASAPDEATGKVQRYASEGAWKQRFLHLEFGTEGFSLALYRPRQDKAASSPTDSNGSSPLLGPGGIPSSVYLPSSPSGDSGSRGGTPKRSRSKGKNGLDDSMAAPNLGLDASTSTTTAIKRGFKNNSTTKGAASPSSSSFSSQLRQLTSELDLGDPEHEHMVENRLFREQIKDKRAVERTRFFLPEGIIKLRKIFLGSKPFNSGAHAVDGALDSSDAARGRAASNMHFQPTGNTTTEFFLLRKRSSFTGEYKTVDHEFVVQLYLEEGFLEFVGRTDDNTHLWFQRLQSIIAIHNAYSRVKKMLLNRQMFPVLPGRDEFPIARLVRIEEGGGSGSSTFNNNNTSSASVISRRDSNNDELSALKKAAMYSSNGNFLASSSANNNGSFASLNSTGNGGSSSGRQRYVLQMVLCKMALAHTRKGFDLTIVGRAVSGQTLFWRMCLDDVPVIHETDQYATILAVPLTQADRENLGTEPSDELFLCRREPEMLRILRGGEASERVGKGTGGLYYLNKWANFLSVFSRLYTASHPTAFQRWGGEAGAIDDGEGDASAASQNGGDGSNKKGSSGNALNAASSSKKDRHEYMMAAEARLNADLQEEQDEVEREHRRSIMMSSNSNSNGRPPLPTSPRGGAGGKGGDDVFGDSIFGTVEKSQIIRPSNHHDDDDEHDSDEDFARLGDEGGGGRPRAGGGKGGQLHKDPHHPQSHSGHALDEHDDSSHLLGRRVNGEDTAPPTPVEGRSRSNSVHAEDDDRHHRHHHHHGHGHASSGRGGGGRYASPSPPAPPPPNASVGGGDGAGHMPLQRVRSRKVVHNGSFVGSDSGSGTLRQQQQGGGGGCDSDEEGDRRRAGHHDDHQWVSSEGGGSRSTSDNTIFNDHLHHHASDHSPQASGGYYNPAPVPGASSVPGLDNLTANFVRRINSFKTLKGVASEAVGLSEVDARIQASMGARQREKAHRQYNAGTVMHMQHSEGLAVHEGAERAQLDALAVQYSGSTPPASGRASPEGRSHRTKGGGGGGPLTWEGGDKGGGGGKYASHHSHKSSNSSHNSSRATSRERSYSSAFPTNDRRSSDPAERLAARLHERGVANVSVVAMPTSSPQDKEQSLRNPTARSYYQRDERALIESMPLLFVEGRHEDAMFAIMGFWQKYPPMVPPVD